MEWSSGSVLWHWARNLAADISGAWLYKIQQTHKRTHTSESRKERANSHSIVEPQQQSRQSNVNAGRCRCRRRSQYSRQRRQLHRRRRRYYDDDEQLRRRQQQRLCKFRSRQVTTNAAGAKLARSALGESQRSSTLSPVVIVCAPRVAGCFRPALRAPLENRRVIDELDKFDDDDDDDEDR